MNDEEGFIELDDDDELLTSAYITLLSAVNDLVKVIDPVAVASIMVTQGLSLYKTVLSDSDYNLMVSKIIDYKDNIIMFDELKPGVLH